MNIPMLSLIIWLPALGALIVALLPRANRNAQQLVAVTAALAALAVAGVTVALFDRGQSGYQFTENLPWLRSWGIGYGLGVDGISVWLVAVTALVMPLAIWRTWGRVAAYPRSFLALLLLLESAILGVFLARDLFLFYAFFEFTLVPMALLIGIFGGEGARAAATKFFIYLFTGSIFMLAAMIGFYSLHGQATGTYTADLTMLFASVQNGFKPANGLDRVLLFGFLIAFAVKTPLWPFHTWLPEAHAQAPQGGAVDIAIVLLKLGAYGLLRLALGLLPDACRWAAPLVAGLALISILYGAIVALAQTDLRRLLAYSTVSHQGYIVLGVFALNTIGISGAVLQMVNYALASSALFLVVGALTDRRGTTDVRNYGGLWKAAPALGGLSLLAVLASVGLPGLNGFVGEFLVMQGSWLAPATGPWFVVLAVIGVILAAAYLLRMFRLTFMGEALADVADLGREERAQFALLLIPCIVIGLAPTLLFNAMQGSVGAVAQTLAQAVAAR